MNQLNKIIRNVSFQLYASDFLKCLLVASSVFLLVFSFSKVIFLSILVGFFTFFVAAFLTKLFKSKYSESLQLIHQKLNDTEFSLHLLQKKQLNIAEQLQLDRLYGKTENLKTPIIFTKKTVNYFLVFGFSVLVYLFFPLFTNFKKNNLFVEKKQNKVTDNQQVRPSFVSSKLTVSPPNYTKLPTKTGSEMNVSAIVGSVLKWQLVFENAIDLKVKLANNQGEELTFKKYGETYEYTDKLYGSGLYSFRAYEHDSLVFQSDYFNLTAIADFAPKIEPTSKELYTFHYLKDPKNIQISARISDDFMVNQAFVVATVARGSGENVKFRELKLPLLPTNFKEATLSKNIDLKALNFAPGDELYYYWAAIDNKTPEANFAKSDTYFIVYKDTSQVEESDLATMAMNILPEYFRSQRQIIIDSEKLIKKRNKISQKDFNSESNEIGFDQKALRLRYGQYLGEEFESSIGSANALPTDVEGDLLAGFVHAHDEGEHDHEDGGHDHKNEEKKGNEGEKDPVAAILEEYVHAHDDAETNTFYEQSTRSLLKSALEQMWSSELHLRLYEPEKALPFEKKALEFLKLAQQKARAYVKKTSFDPPPIKENEKRMTGELTKFNENFSKEKNYTETQIEQLISEVIGIVEIKKTGKKLNGFQKQKVLNLGGILSQKPTNNSFSVLGDLQLLLNDKDLTEKQQKELKNKLFRLINGFFDNKNKTENRTYKENKILEKAYWRFLQ